MARRSQATQVSGTPGLRGVALGLAIGASLAGLWLWGNHAAQAQDAKAFDRTDAQLYEACIQLATENAEAAFEQAIAWRDLGGGRPARHCVALALYGLGQYREAALRLERLAKDAVAEDNRLRASILGQAGHAWTAADDLTRAYAALTTALELNPNNVDLLLDRSLALAVGKSYWDALDDLNQVLDNAPGHVEALVFRATAYRYLDAPELALDDVNRALSRDSVHVGALLERGILRRITGDAPGARADWLKVLERAPDSPAADAARRNIELLDIPSD